MFCYVMSRGVEVLDAEENTINTIPNNIKLHKLFYPLNQDDKFELKLIQSYTHPEYRSNSWGVKISSNGKYIAAPTYDGNVFFFHIKSGEVGCILRDHKEIEMRDVLFHDSADLVFTCADGKIIFI